MFSKRITSLTLTSEVADEIFSNIRGESYKDDRTFVATLRALLGSRMREDEDIWVSVTERSDPESSVRNSDEIDVINAFSEKVEDNSILICGFNGTEGSVLASFEKIEKLFVKTNTGYDELEDIHAFFAELAYMRVYINVESKSAAVFVDNLDVRIWHLIQSVLSRIVPWYFKDKPLNDDEIKLLWSLKNRYATKYENLIEAFASGNDFRNKKIQKMIGGFETRSKQMRLESVRGEIRRQERSIEQNLEIYRELVINLEDMRVRECGLAYQIKECGDSSELVDYFVCNKHVNPVEARDNSIKIIVDCTIENYDPDMYENMTNNPRSYLFTGYEVSAEAFAEVGARKKFLDAIFGEDSVLKIKVCAYYDLDLGGSVFSMRGYHYPKEYENHLPNPHIDRFACIGNNVPLINTHLRKGDYISAIEQCVSSAKNLNLAEGEQTVAPFMAKVFCCDCKAVIQLPDGTSCTPTEAYEWLLSQEEDKDQEDTE